MIVFDLFICRIPRDGNGRLLGSLRTWPAFLGTAAWIDVEAEYLASHRNDRLRVEAASKKAISSVGL